MVKEKVSAERWEIAQHSEKEYWNEFDIDRLNKEESIRHKNKAALLEKEFEKFYKIDINTKILQIGCGPEDIINYFSKGKKYAVDPLASFYKNKFKINYKNVMFLEGRGEKLPFKDDFFDIVILANVLDHVEFPEKVLFEISRVMKEKGIFHFENFFYQKSFIVLAKIFSFFKKISTGKIFNIHHPFMFTLPFLKRLISKNFQIIEDSICRELGDYENVKELKKQKLKNKKLSIKLPALFGLYGTINYMAICRKRKL